MPRQSPHPPQTRQAAAARAADLRDHGNRRFLQTVADEVGVKPDTVRVWITAYGFLPASATPPPTRSGTDRPFALYGIVGHRTCGNAFQPAKHPDLGPAYTCAPGCRQPLTLPADEVHAAAIRAVSVNAPAAARRNGDPSLEQLRTRVRHISIARSLDDLRIAWRNPVLAGYSATTEASAR